MEEVRKEAVTNNYELYTQALNSQLLFPLLDENINKLTSKEDVEIRKSKLKETLKLIKGKVRRNT